MTLRLAFESVMKSMLSVGFEEEEVVSIVSILGGVLLMGNIVSHRRTRGV